MKKEFSVGTRVAFYTLNGRYTGTVLSLPNVSGIIEVGFGNGAGTFVHEMQCRRLVKKPRRRVWIHVMDIPKPGGLKVAAATLSGDPEEGHIEFIEVRKKK